MIEFLDELPMKLGETRESYFLIGGGFGYCFIYDIAENLDMAMELQEKLVKKNIDVTIKKYRLEAVNIELTKKERVK